MSYGSTTPQQNNSLYAYFEEYIKFQPKSEVAVKNFI